jgi:putative ABC transport system substrate-binding protein
MTGFHRRIKKAEIGRREFFRLLGGVALAAPRTAGAQQKATPVIGFLASNRMLGSGFQQGLSETGYVEGRNVVIEYRLEQGDYDRMPAAAADLLGRKIDLITAIGPAAAQAAKRATSTIPIVFISGDPIDEGLVAGLARPGGNLTGVSLTDVELMPKRLDLLSEMVPRARVFALLVNPNASNAEAIIRRTHDAALAKGAELQLLKAGTDGEIDAAFAALSQLHAGALVVADDLFFRSRSPYLAALASRHAVPAMYGWSDFAWAGGLISYSPSQTAALRQLGIYAGKILNGAQPADLPVVQPTKFELVVNLKTAQALGLTVPQTILALANEVIE